MARHFLLIASVVLLLSRFAVAEEPAASAVAEVEARRSGLEDLALALRTAKQRGLRPDEATIARTERALAELAKALASKDDHVRASALQDVLNRVYHSFPAGAMAGILMPHVKSPAAANDADHMPGQGLLMEHLGRFYAQESQAVLPALLTVVTDDRVSPYLRGQAIEASARIGKDDPAVVEAFLKAAKNPNPDSSSGVHDRIAEKLGEMGQHSPKVSETLQVVMGRGPWYQDPAFVALGKLSLDEAPRPLDEYLRRLETVDRIRLEQAAAALLHVQSIINPAAEVRHPNSSAAIDRRNVDEAAAAKARPVLFKLVDDRPNDVYSRAALRTLEAIGPGGGKDAARIVVEALLEKDHSSNAEYVLDLLEPTDSDAAEVLRSAFQDAPKDGSWVTRQLLARAIGRYGRQGASATPAMIEALKDLRPAESTGHANFELFTTFLSTLVAVGDPVRVQTVVLELLEPESPFITRSGAAAAHYQAALLQTFANVGLPDRDPIRIAALRHIGAGLESRTDIVFQAAARSLVARPELSVEETQPLVARLLDVLKDDTGFRDSDGQPLTARADREDQRPREELLLAVTALGAMRQNAKDALPALESVASRPLAEERASYLPPPPMNAVIRAARKAVEAIRTGSARPK
jgi:hypothetical protein